jgi:prepilin-type N-terminal cleavage/methylation domain-containing protein
MFDRACIMNGESKTPSGGRASSLFSSRQHFRRHSLTSTQPRTSGSDSPKKKAIPRFGGCDRDHSAHFSEKQNNSRGFTVAELLIVLLVGTVLTAIAIPVMSSAMAIMRLNSTVSAITAAISQTHYRAIMNSQLYTLVLTTPNNTYVVTNVTTNTADAPMPLPNQAIALNGGASATYTFTLCPNGTVYGAGGTCPGNNLPPALTATYQGRQTNINVSSVGNVTAKIVH